MNGGLATAYYVVVSVLISLGVAYAALDIFLPAVAVRWQVTSTRRRRGFLRSVGTSFQKWMGYQSSEPWKEPAVLQRVRILGVVLLLLMLAYAVVFLLLLPGHLPVGFR